MKISRIFVLVWLSTFLLIFYTLSFSQERVAARYYYPVADSIARSMLDELSLIIIRSDSVDLFGKSATWDYAYQGLKISFTADMVIIDTTFGEWSGSSTIENGWFNSDSAFSIAEKSGGAEFRQTHPTNQIVMDLGHDSASPWTEWMVRYSSKRDLTYRYFYINAHTGEIIYDYTTSVITQQESFSYSLAQNYPNPFNSSTNICYNLNKPSHINLKIYDITGRLIRVLISDFKQTGSHMTQWDGRDENQSLVSSGIYFVKFAIDDELVGIQKMIFVK